MHFSALLCLLQSKAINWMGRAMTMHSQNAILQHLTTTTLSRTKFNKQRTMAVRTDQIACKSAMCKAFHELSCLAVRINAAILSKLFPIIPIAVYYWSPQETLCHGGGALN